MGVWAAIAKATLDNQAFQEADRRQNEYNQAMGIGQYGGPGIIATFFANRRASRWGRQYEEDNRQLQQANNPHGPQHRPGCTCRFCFRGFVNNGFGQ